MTDTLSQAIGHQIEFHRMNDMHRSNGIVNNLLHNEHLINNLPI